MTVSPTGWKAIFKPYREEPIVGWDDLGYPLIVDPATGKRIDAHDLDDHEFCNLEPADLPFVGVVPADGWALRWNDGSTDSILAFAMQADGVLRPVVDSYQGHGSPYFRASDEAPPTFTRRTVS